MVGDCKGFPKYVWKIAMVNCIMIIDPVVVPLGLTQVRVPLTNKIKTYRIQTQCL